MIILLHSSKTMHNLSDKSTDLEQPILLDKAKELANYMHTLTAHDIEKTMGVSAKLAEETRTLIQSWTFEQSVLSAALDTFAGDIYSGLQTHTWTTADRTHANNVLRILSGLYGILKPLDGICPYRLEMGYKLPSPVYRNLYKFWDDTIAETLPKVGPIINLAAAEYSKTVLPYVDSNRVLTPRFLTISPKTHEPTFVVVHAKIARGAFAQWIIKNRISSPEALIGFNILGYSYDPARSTEAEPVFICKQFEGLGLSVRLRNKK